eukprot:g44885.t1
MDTPDDQPLNPNQRYAPHETAITYFSYNPSHSQQPWKAMMLHRSLCHANYQAMQRVASSDGKGMEKGAKEKVKACPGCHEGKATKQPYYKENHVDRQYKKGEALNFDFKGPYLLASVYGNMYSATLSCSASKFARDFYTPSRAARFYLRHITIGFLFFETQTGNKCKVFRCDGELATTAVLQMCEDNGTIFKQTTRDESRMNLQNGFTEATTECVWLHFSTLDCRTYIGRTPTEQPTQILLHNHRRPTVVDKRSVTFNSEVRATGYGIKGAQQLTW